MKEDRKYCMSSFLTFRTIADEGKCFKEGLVPHLYKNTHALTQIHSSFELENFLKEYVASVCNEKKSALALSGGIDSAILAKFMPKGSTAYTFKCIVPGVKVTDETFAAARYAEECGLQHKIIEIYWEDFLEFSSKLMLNKGMPIHSIEVQIYKAAVKAKEDGIENLIFGESCDVHYGGLDKLLSEDWTFGEYVDRYSFVKPYHVLKDFDMVMEPFRIYEKNGRIDVFKFLREFAHMEGMGSYQNACDCAEVNFVAPYAYTRLAVPLDLKRIRQGEGKYMVRELFRRLYPSFEIPVKTPMPRPMNEWMQKWAGPTRKEFLPNCVTHFSGDQKWLVWATEKFLNLIDEI